MLCDDAKIELNASWKDAEGEKTIILAKKNYRSSAEKKATVESGQVLYHDW